MIKNSHNLPDVALLLSKMVTIDMGDDETWSESVAVEKKLIVGPFLSRARALAPPKATVL
jgi:hypothetical protein